MYTLTERARVIRLPQMDSERKIIQQSEAQLINSDPYMQYKQMLKLIHFPYISASMSPAHCQRATWGLH